MKSSPDVESISADALYYVTKAAVRPELLWFITVAARLTQRLFLQEFFVEHLAQEIFENCDKKKDLTYSGLADIVQEDESMEFLKGSKLF